MKKQTEIIDETSLVFRKKSREYISRLSGSRFSSRVLLRTIPFPSYGAAMAFVTDIKLGLDRDKKAWELHNGWLSKVWKPIRLERRIYRPGKGTVVMIQKLETTDGAT